ncbi:D-aminoacyl-tRNA deacylase 1 [Bagarius yarrelli]|uniref:D-aminoacyl-tRNA deacylase 1 n=1 Tax=Bagarius yarrelli TaxID=175774 RepID=A0A556V874_BAGYA|nr:D-aminoacyl-tRNA deacylase 1 [Bagarius yarrelli]
MRRTAAMYIEIGCFFCCICGWILICSTLPTEYWNFSEVGDAVLTTVNYYSNLWMDCVSDTTGVSDCKYYPSLMALPGLSGMAVYSMWGNRMRAEFVDINYKPQRVRRILNVRVFENENGSAWTRSVMDKGLEVLCVSQFTLQCTLKGNKPDFHLAMPADVAHPIYNNILKQLRKAYKPELIKDGRFGACMQVHIQNDGPVTIFFESPAMCMNAQQLSKLEKQQQRKEKTITKGNLESSKDKGALYSNFVPIVSDAEVQMSSEEGGFENSGYIA